MLHSFQYYAYCYALLCFLQQQHQQVASLAIIVDGATTNEWVTRDEYQRLVDANGSQEGGQQAASESVAAQQMLSPNQQQQQQQQQVADEQSQPANNKQQAQEQQQLQVHVPAALEGPILELLQERQAQGEALKAAEQLESALERLDLIERQRAPGRNRLSINRQQQQQQQRQPEQERHHSSRARGRLATSSAQLNARTLNDLVPVGDRSHSGQALRNLKERGSTPQRYCGKMLVDMLEVVCQGRYYSGDSGALTVEPTVKSKRFKRGVTAECCHRPCHLDELKPYCET